MTDLQLEQLTEICKPYYKGTGKWHAWDHVCAVRKFAQHIAETEFPDANIKCVIAAATIHDIGRVVRDEGHAEESGKIILPILKALAVDPKEVDIILDAVTNHDVKKIDQAKTTEARIVFDADKIEILSVYGFTRVWYWLIEERNMEIGEALRFLSEYCDRFKDKLHSTYAKKLVSDEFPTIITMREKFYAYEAEWRSGSDTV